MNMRLEMLQVARLAPKSLGDSTELIRTFLQSQLHEDGGFKDRSGKSDLYYTVFGIDSLIALQAELPYQKLENYLKSFDTGKNLDFVHLACLARCWSALWNRPTTIKPATPAPHATPPAAASASPKPEKKKIRFQKNAPPPAPPPQVPVPTPNPQRPELKKEILRRIERYRSFDGGYNPALGSNHGTAYSGFLAVGAYQDMDEKVPDEIRLIQCLKLAGTDEGDWRKEPRVKSGSTPAIAAAITLLNNLGMVINPDAAKKLLSRAHQNGGFLAAPKAPVPDLLSTATALHALTALEVSLAEIKEKCLDFVDTLWVNDGGFHAHWHDDAIDVEYVYYGLLALGHLSL